MADWLIDKTDLIALKFDLQREARVGSAVLGLLELGEKNRYASMIPGGLVTGWLPDVKEIPNTGLMIRKFMVLLIAPVTISICQRVAVLQMGGLIYKKESETPYDGVSTPKQWVYTVSYVGAEGGIEL